MNAIWYLYKRTIINKTKKAIHKPISFLLLIVFIAYLVCIPFVFGELVKEFNLNSSEGLIICLTALTFWALPANFIAYTKRKGLLYKKSDTHFLFPTPIGPKKILLYAHLRTIITTAVLNIYVLIFGIYVFGVKWYVMLFYAIFSIVIENIFEAAVMMILYGSEKIKEVWKKYLIIVAYSLIAIFLLIGLFYILRFGFQFETFILYLLSDEIKFVPIIGWYIGVLHLLFSGPTFVNCFVSICYLLLMLFVIYFAFKMNCSGEFYEDAAKFADDYEALVTNRKQGRMDVKFGKKTKYKDANIQYKGNSAKAIFYRQLLEYKKSKYFIFDFTTIVNIIASIVLVFLYSTQDLEEFANFLLPGLCAYLIFIFAGNSGKWGRELISPYTFMIPDTALKKLYYATLMQHIQGFINGCIIIIPSAIVLQMSILQMILAILFYVILNGCKLYVVVVARILLGNLVGETARQFFQMFLLSIAIGFGVLGAMLGMFLNGLTLMYLLMSLFMLLIMITYIIIATTGFYNMESAE